MSNCTNITVSDLPDAIAQDIVKHFNRMDHYFGDCRKHEHWLKWEYLLPHTTTDASPDELSQFLEIEGRLFLLPMRKHYHHLLKFLNASFSKDETRATVFFAIDPEKARDSLGVFFTGVIAIADLYEKDGISFYLGQYLHYAYLVGKEAQVLERNNLKSTKAMERELFR